MANTKTLIDINKQAGEMQNLQPVSASRSQMESMIAKYFSHGSSQNHLQEPDPSPRKSPEPPDFNQSDPISEIKAFTKLSSLKSKTRKLAIPLKYSCDEIYDRMTNGLCIFCEEQDTPDHQLKHKRFQIFMKESDDRPSDDMSLESAIEEIYDECVVESVDHVSVALDQEGEQGSDEEEEHAKTTVQDSSSRPNEYQDDSATQIKPSNDIQLSFSQEYSGSHRSTLSSLEMDQCISDRNCNEEKRSSYLSRGDRIWEPGGLSAIMEPEKYHTHDNMMELPSKLHKMGTQQNSNGVGILDSFSELIDSEGVKKKLSYMKSLKVNEVAFHVYGGSTTGYVIISLPQWVLEIGKENLSDCEGRSFECLNWSTDKELVLHGLPDFLLAKRVWEPGGISASDGAHTLLLISGHLATQKFSSVKEISVVSPKGTSVTGFSGLSYMIFRIKTSGKDLPLLTKKESEMPKVLVVGHGEWWFTIMLAAASRYRGFDWLLRFICNERVKESKPGRIQEHFERDNDKEGREKLQVLRKEIIVSSETTHVVRNCSLHAKSCRDMKHKVQTVIMKQQMVLDSEKLYLLRTELKRDANMFFVGNVDEWFSEVTGNKDPNSFCEPIVEYLREDMVSVQRVSYDMWRVLAGFDFQNKRVKADSKLLEWRSWKFKYEDLYGNFELTEAKQITASLEAEFATNAAQKKELQRETVNDAGNKRLMDIEDYIINKPITTWEVSHFQDVEYGTTGHKLLSVRKISRKGTEGNSWTFMWIIVKEVSETEFEKETWTITKHLQGLSTHEKDHKLLFPKNHKLLHPGAGFWTKYNDVEQLSIERHSSPGLNYFTHLVFLRNQALICGCKVDHISCEIHSVVGIHELDTCSKPQTGNETQGKRLMALNEGSLLDNANKLDVVVKENWFYNKPEIDEVFHLLRPPEIIQLHDPDSFTKSSELSSLRTRMLSTREYCDRKSIDTLVYILFYLISFGLVTCNYVNRYRIVKPVVLTSSYVGHSTILNN